MLEQEIASIIKFVLDKTDNPAPYYYNVPQSFHVPAAYFPLPEIDTAGDTLNSFGAEYSWYINFFDITTQKAFERGNVALNAIKQNRNLIPLIDMDGTELKRGVRVKDPSLKGTADGVAQLTIHFVSRRPYKRPETTKVQNFEVVFKAKPYTSTIITEAMEAAVSQYLAPEK